MSLNFHPIWFDSMGAKSSCTLVSTSDVSVLIDPGVAMMQPSFPASDLNKALWMKKGKNAIKKASEKADILVISHYHYDHFFPDEINIYNEKTIFLKNPNEYINDSQRIRAERLFENFSTIFKTEKTKDFPKKQNSKKYVDPMHKLPLAKNKDFKSYAKRRDELLKKGKRWFHKRVNKWNSYKTIPEIEHRDMKVIKYC